MVDAMVGVRVRFLMRARQILMFSSSESTDVYASRASC